MNLLFTYVYIYVFNRYKCSTLGINFQIDPTEIIALKAIMFFDHTASQLTNVKKVKRIRNQVRV